MTAKISAIPRPEPAPTLQHELAHDLQDWEPIPSSPALFFLGGSCSCPLPGPCLCGAVLE